MTSKAKVTAKAMGKAEAKAKGKEKAKTKGPAEVKVKEELKEPGKTQTQGQAKGTGATECAETEKDETEVGEDLNHRRDQMNARCWRSLYAKNLLLVSHTQAYENALAAGAARLTGKR